MSEAPARVMMIGAHPDDCDFRAGGCAGLWRQAGFEVRFVSATNGDAGHHLSGGGPLARRRQAEARAAGEVMDIDYLLLDLHDGELVPALENRRTFIQVIREFAPDLLITHRPWDYHPDHRYTGMLVQDASFLVTVPNVCALTPEMDQAPVILYAEDGFRKPMPFDADVVVDIDSMIERKGDMLYCHESQVFEWLVRGSEVPDDEAGRRALIRQRVRARSHHTAERFRDKLIDLYGAECGPEIETAEAFEVCEYGAPLTAEAKRRLFPFVPWTD